MGTPGIPSRTGSAQDYSGTKCFYENRLDRRNFRMNRCYAEGNGIVRIAIVEQVWWCDHLDLKKAQYEFNNKSKLNKSEAEVHSNL